MPNEVNNTPVEVESHGYMYEVFIGFFVTFFDFIKYIFYDMWLGE